MTTTSYFPFGPSGHANHFLEPLSATIGPLPSLFSCSKGAKSHLLFIDALTLERSFGNSKTSLVPCCKLPGPQTLNLSPFKFYDDDEIHWCPRMPLARTFPAHFFTAFSWDLRDICVKFLELQTQIAISKNMQYKHHLLDVSQFLSLFPDLENSPLRDDFLGPLWIGRHRQKSRLSRWEKTALKLTYSQTVRSVTAKPISFWIQLPAEDIKKMISPPKSTKRQFLCLHKYFNSVLRSIGRHWRLLTTTPCLIS